MRTVKVLLRESVKDLGHVGDVVQVRPGFARNYLLPQRLAIEATDDNIIAMERRRTRFDAEMAKREEEVTALVASFGELRLSTKEKADEKGTLYGSVGAAAIAKLMTEAGHAVEEKDVRLNEPIKAVGEHEVPIHIHGDHYASVQVQVEALT